MTDNDFIRRCIDDRLSDEEFAAFNERLRTDSAFRERYVRIADLEACLYDEFSESQSAVHATAAPAKSSSIKWLRVLSCLAIAICLILLVFKSNFGRTLEVNSLTSTLNPDSASSAISDADLTKSVFTESVPKNVADAAVIVVVHGDHSDKVVAGRRIQPGVLKLETGYVQLEFFSGAVVGLTGPAELRIESKDAATLLSGKVTAHVPERGRGFVLNAPGAAVVDLGTEFGVRIDETGTAEVEVLSGEVELSLLGDDGNTLHSERVEDSKAVRVDSRLNELTEIPGSPESFPRIHLSSDMALSVSDAYIDAVRNCQPIVYWRFEEPQANTAVNDVGEHWLGTFYNSNRNPDGIRIANGHATFKRTDTPRYVSISDPIADLNEESFSIEFWMRPDDLAHATVLGVYPETDLRAKTHLNVVEIVANTFLIHAPGAIRFLHRNPPEADVKAGINIFSSGICTPLQWQHVVVVKDSESLQMYYNGELARRVAATDTNGPGAFMILVGQLKPTSTERQFSGAIDELAIYRSRLNAAEIKNHFLLMKSQQPGAVVEN